MKNPKIEVLLRDLVDVRGDNFVEKALIRNAKG